MGKERLGELIHNTPEEKLRRHFKIAVTTFEPDFPKDQLSISSEELFEDRKRRQCSLRSVHSMTDQEFIEDWMIYADIPPYYAMEIGKALGEMSVEQKNTSSPQASQRFVKEVASR